MQTAGLHRSEGKPGVLDGIVDLHCHAKPTGLTERARERGLPGSDEKCNREIEGMTLGAHALDGGGVGIRQNCENRTLRPIGPLYPAQ